MLTEHTYDNHRCPDRCRTTLIKTQNIHTIYTIMCHAVKRASAPRDSNTTGGMCSRKTRVNGSRKLGRCRGKVLCYRIRRLYPAIKGKKHCIYRLKCRVKFAEHIGISRESSVVSILKMIPRTDRRTGVPYAYTPSILATRGTRRHSNDLLRWKHDHTNAFERSPARVP